MQYSEYLKTDYWKAVTAKVKERAGYRCQLCNSQHDLCAHHRTYEHREREMDFLSDLTCLCRRCHEIFHGKNQETAPPKSHHAPILAKPVGKSRVLVRPIDHDAIDALMPVRSGIFTLTAEHVENCRINGVFTSATIQALGVRDLKSGWVKRLVGMPIQAAHYRKALEGRNIYSPKGARKLAAGTAWVLHDGTTHPAPAPGNAKEL